MPSNMHCSQRQLAVSVPRSRLTSPPRRGWSLDCFAMKRWMIPMFVITASFPLYGGVETSHLLGSGEPGLKIVFADNTTNQFAIYLDEAWTVGPGFIGGYDKRHIEVLSDHSYGLKEKLKTRTWRDDPRQLYPYDDETVFTCEGDSRFPNDRIYKTNSMGESISDDGKRLGFPRVTAVYATNTESILVSNDVYAMASLHYGLATNQLFLGRLGTNIFYWETQNLRKVFFRSLAEGSATSYFDSLKA